MKEEPKIFFITTIGTAKTRRVSHPRLKPNGWIMIVQSILQVGVNSADSTEFTGPVEYPLVYRLADFAPQRSRRKPGLVLMVCQTVTHRMH